MYKVEALEMAALAWAKHARENTDDPRVKDPTYAEGWVEGYATAASSLGLDLDIFEELDGK